MNQVPCPVCGNALSVRKAASRRAAKPKVFLMLICSVDGRHFRGFIQDRDYVNRVLERLEQLSNADSDERAAG